MTNISVDQTVCGKIESMSVYLSVILNEVGASSHLKHVTHYSTPLCLYKFVQVTMSLCNGAVNHSVLHKHIIDTAPVFTASVCRRKLLVLQ